MARSLWKGKTIPINFVNPSYAVTTTGSGVLKKKALNLKESRPTFFGDSIKLFRRNHLMLQSQSKILQILSPYYVYNGYDFFRQESKAFNLPSAQVNLASVILTREMNTIHKVKLTKAARIKKASTQKKINLKKSSNKTSSLQKRKPVLNKKFKK